MQRVAIVTDSTACLSRELGEAHGIEIVPTEMVFEGRVYRDGVDSAEDFYAQLRKAKKPPTTSAPSPGLFLEAYARAAKRAESVLCITIPEELSSTHNSSQQAIALARDEMPDVRIISLPAPAVASGQGLVALEAAEAAERGGDLETVAALVAELAPRVHFFAVLESLEHLAKGGHVPKAAAWLGDLVGLKPILTSRGGVVERLSQARSKRGAVAKMIRLMEERNSDGLPIRALVMHADVPGEALRFREQIESRFPCESLSITQFTPVMGAHSGPGVVGVAFRTVERRGNDA
jgi:DegV family protein with EDD domain